MRSKLMKLGVAAVAIGLIGGCMPKPKPEPKGAAWAQEGKTQDQLRADFGLCGGAFDAAGTFKYADENLAAIDKCMQGKGYARTR